MKHSSQYAFDYAVLAKEIGKAELASIFYIFDHFGVKEIKKALEEKRITGTRYYDDWTKCGCLIGVNIKDYQEAFLWSKGHKSAGAAEIWLFGKSDRSLGLVAKAIQLWETRPRTAE